MTDLLELLRHFDISAGVWLGLVDATFKATVILAVAVLGVLSMRRSAPRHRYAMLTIAVFGVLAVPLLSGMMPRLRVPLLPKPTAEINGQDAIPPHDFVSAAPTNALLTTATKSEIDPQSNPATSRLTVLKPAFASTDYSHQGTELEQAAEVAALHAEAGTPSVHAQPIAVPAQQRTDSAPALAWLSHLDYTMIAIAVWAIGLLVGLCWMMFGTLRVNKWRRRGTAVDDAAARRVARQVSQGLRLRRQVSLIETDAIDSPITWGELRPIVLLPTSWREWPTERLRIVMLHELTHVRRHDWLVQMCARLACVVHWFNPLVWFVARRLEEVRELACDDDVVRIGTRPSTYAETLLDIATRMRRRPVVAAVALNMAARTRLEGRLTSILGTTYGSQRRGLALHATLIFVAASVLAMAAIEPWRNQDAIGLTRAGTTPNEQLGARPAIDTASFSDFAIPKTPQLAAGIRDWKTQSRAASWSRTASKPDSNIVLASAIDMTSAIPAVAAMAMPDDDASHSSQRLLDRAADDHLLLWQKAKATYRDEEQTVRRAVLAGEFDVAKRGVDLAAQIIESNRVYAPSASEVSDYRQRVDALRTYVTDEARQHDEQAIRAKLEEIKQRETVRLAAMADTKRRQVEELMTRAETLNGQERYDEAHQVLDQLIALDPKNERALWLRSRVEDIKESRRDRLAVASRDHETRTLLISVDEDGIPYADDIRYPDDWPEKSARRRSTRDVRESEDTRQARARLRTRAPEIRFDGTTFEDVVDRLRAMTGLNIVPNWSAMAAVAVEKDAEISLKLNDVSFEKTLDLVLSEVGGGEVELGYEIDEGIIRISTKEDLSRHTKFEAYDIRDLIVGVPNFKGPEIDITQAGQNQNQQGGIAGGRFVGQGGVGGGAGAGGGGGNSNLFEENGQDNEETNPDDAIGPLIDLIQQTIEPDSWREAGGNVGSISTLNQQLIVTQTSSAHAQLRDL